MYRIYIDFDIIISIELSKFELGLQFLIVRLMVQVCKILPLIETNQRYEFFYKLYYGLRVLILKPVFFRCYTIIEICISI
jgi:hypothetical protein